MGAPAIQLMLLEPALSVCKLAAGSLPGEAAAGAFFALVKTEDELSLVCESRLAPPDALQAEQGWRALKVAGTLDFGLVGVIAGISAALAGAGVPLFVVSTFDTDYVLVKQENLDKAAGALRAAGYALHATGENA